MLIRKHCCHGFSAGLLLLLASIVMAQPNAMPSPEVPPVAQSPLSSYINSINATDTEMETRVVDLNPVIAGFAQKSGLTPEKAKIESLTYLGLLVLQRSGKSPEFRSDELRPGVFQVTAPRSYHAMLRHAMESLRHGKKQICLELRLIYLPKSKLGTLDGHLPRRWSTVGSGQLPLFQPVATSGDGPFRLTSSSGKAELVTTNTRTVQEVPTRLMTLSAKEADKLIEHFNHDATSSTVSVPRITLFPGQTGSIADMSQRPFVVSVKPIVGELGTAFQPIIQVVEEGTVVRIRATLRDDQIQLASDMAFSEVEDVDTFTFVPEGSNEETTVQLPKQKVRQIHLSKWLDDGSTLLVDPQIFKESTSRGMFGREITTRKQLLLMLSVKVLEG